MSNDKFEWTDSKVLEFALKVKTTGDAEWVMPQLEQFKQEQLSKRDWEILKFKHKVTGVIDDISRKLDKVNPDWWLTCVEQCWEIHSVRRLSDGEVFVVGEQVERNNCNDNIHGFEVDGDRVKVSFACDTMIGFFDLNEISKAKKQVLLTDDNGNQIMEGDVFWLLYTAPNGIGHAHETKMRKELLPLKSYQKAFSTKEAAEEYIVYNKPYLSVNDVVLAMQDNPTDCRKCGKHVHGTHTKMQLIELAKSKMDGKK